MWNNEGKVARLANENAFSIPVAGWGGAGLNLSSQITHLSVIVAASMSPLSRLNILTYMPSFTGMKKWHSVQHQTQSSAMIIIIVVPSYSCSWYTCPLDIGGRASI
jgi:hypothetical protein